MSVRRAVVVAAVLTTAWVAAGIPLRATYGARTTADEPQYLLSAMSLAEDFDLDIGDELRAERWRDFHEAGLPRQTEPLDDGSDLSPHDPLLPLLLAGPFAVAGWAGAKAALALMAGALAALLVWTAHRRFGVPVAVALGVTLAFTLTAPLVVYGEQVYPELPAALAVTVAIAAATGPFRRSAQIAFVVAVVALPWLAVKYTPVAAALAAVALVLLWRRGEAATAGVVAAMFAAAAIAFLVVHQRVYGGWTVYAAGDEFTGGEFTVAGRHPDVWGRSGRLIGLMTDRSFGLAAWAPAYLLAVPAFGALARARPRGTAALAVPLAAGWLTATFVALTMHGYWWPGRQVVVVLPAVVLAVAWWITRVGGARRWLAALTAAGLVMWTWVAVEVLTERRRLIIDFDQTANPLYRAWRLLLPDYRDGSLLTWVEHGAWIAAFAALAIAGWRSLEPRRKPDDPATLAPEAAADTGSGSVAPVGSGGMR